MSSSAKVTWFCHSARFQTSTYGARAAAPISQTNTATDSSE
nr:hypothetical protein [Oricola nitratireducens]